MVGAGDRLGRYEIVRRLGAGAGGEVWAAVLHGPEGFRRPVAVKVLRGPVGPRDDLALRSFFGVAARLPPAPSARCARLRLFPAFRAANRSRFGPHAREALVREARLGALLQHPNVVVVLDLGEVEGRTYVAMELVEGASLGAALDAGPLSPLAVVDAGLQACAALAHVHGARPDGAALVHRDVKPSNLLLDRYGAVKLADLGIARLTSEDGVATGTPGFASPEQLDGRPTDPRSDLFSLGVTLAALALGRAPLGTGIPAVVRTDEIDAQVAGGLLDPVERAVPGLGAVVRACLWRDRERRPADAAALAAALSRVRGELPDGPGLPELLAALRPDLAGSSPPRGPVVLRELPDAPTVPFVPGNLPPHRDSFHGRAAEVAAVAQLVRSGGRLVSLLGPGGTGKTRLSLAVARELAPELPGGAWFVDLSEARDLDGVCAAVARALGIELDRREPVAQLGRALAFRGRALFVLDNLEQLVPVLPETLSTWLDAAPAAAFVATSRVALRLQGERRVAVGPLPVPDGVALFLERAPRAPPAADHPTVAAIVEALEGLPLAIELAAARTRLLTPARIAARLSDRLRLLADGDRDRPERQRSLAASLEVSWALLSPTGRAALGQLTVFEGAATLDAIEAVLALPEGGWGLDALDELVEASLLRLEADGERFRMSVTVREWARTRIADGDRRAAEGRHARWYAASGAPDALRALERAGGLERLARLCDDREELAVACRRSLAAGDPHLAVAALLAAAEGWAARGPLSATVALAGEVLAHPLADADRCAALEVLAAAHLAAGRFAEADAPLREGVAIATAVGDRRRELALRGRAAWRAALGGARDEAEREVAEVLAAAERSGDRHLAAAAWREAGGVAWAHGRHDLALERMVRARAAYAALGDARGEGSALGNLGIVSVYLGRYDDARRWLLAADAAIRRYGDARNRGLVLVNLGMTEFQCGRPDLALAHFEAAERVLGEVGDERNLATALSNGALCLRELGRWDDVSERLARARVLQRALGDQRMEAITCWHQGTLAQERGRFAEALAFLDDAAAQARACGLDRALPQLRAKRAFVRFDAGSRDEALAEAAAAVADARATDDWAAVAQTLGSWAAILLRAGDPAAALPLLQEAVTRMPTARDEALLPLLSLLGEARALTGSAEGLAEIDRAIAVFRAGGYVPSLAEALLQRARVSRAAGRPAEAEAARTEAEALLAPLALPPEAPLARLLAAETGRARSGATGPR